MSTLTPDNLARAVKLQVAQHIVRSVNGITVDSEYLASVIQEITPETQISGASLLHLYIIDPYWVVQRSGLLDTDPTSGELAHDVDVNFPEGSDLWWRLAMVDGGDDLNDANLELTFVDRAVAYMQDDWGPLGVSPGTTTRAQFIKQLVDRVPRVLHVQPIKFVCPELNVVQPVASSTTNSLGTAVVQNATGVSTKANKTPALGHGAAVTVKGSPITTGQIAVVNAALGEARALGAPSTAWNAIIYAGMGESSLGADAGTSTNVWQANNPSLYKDTAGMAAAWLQGTGPDFQAGGGIASAKRGDAVWLIANEVEANKIYNDTGGDSYAHQWTGGQAQGLAEAQNIVNAYGGATLPSGASTGTAGASDISQLTRGTPQNPDEDSWTCGQRLASEVNWNLFSNGDFLYLMDGPDLISQQPAIYLTLGEDGITWTATDPGTGKKKASSSASRIITSLKFTVDDSAFKYQSTHKRRGRVQRQTAIRKPQTASQVKLNMVCGFFEFSAGQVFVFQDAGALNGRWIVEDTTRNCFADTFTQFTLGPPVVPYPEPQATSTGTTPSAVLSTSPGSPSGVADAANQALARQQSGHMFHYSQQRPIQYGILTDNPVNIDCSGFAIACYKAAGLPDPSHNNYNGQGFTGDMITHCKQVGAGEALPGDLCFFGSPGATTHVNVYIGNGQSISMGQEGDPSQGPAAQMGPSGFLGYYRSDVATSTSLSISLPQTPTSSGKAPTVKGGAFAEIGAINTIVDVESDTWLFPVPKGFTG